MWGKPLKRGVVLTKFPVALSNRLFSRRGPNVSANTKNYCGRLCRNQLVSHCLNPGGVWAERLGRLVWFFLERKEGRTNWITKITLYLLLHRTRLSRAWLRVRRHSPDNDWMVWIFLTNHNVQQDKNEESTHQLGRTWKHQQSPMFRFYSTNIVVACLQIMIIMTGFIISRVN